MFLSTFEPYSFPLLGLVRLPEVVISSEDKQKVGLKSNASNKNYLKAVCWVGYKAKRAAGKFDGFSEESVKQRLSSEFSVFESTGMMDYMLLVWDYLNWCDRNQIPRGPGRGSSASSVALYCLGCTDVNPLHHPSLTFTRFLSEARAKPKVVDGIIYADGKSMCDIDSDISFVQRDRLIKYVEDRYAGKTCKISTRLQLTGKMALKSTLKTYLELDDTQAKIISDGVESNFGKVQDINKALIASKELKAWADESKIHQKTIRIARGLESLNYARGVHPSGVFISFYPLDGTVATESAKDGAIVTSVDMNVAATISVKADLLGLRSIDAIDLTCNLVGIKACDININDESIYKYLQTSEHLLGLFQIEQGLTRSVIIKTKPRHIDDLAACLAISRPSSLKYIEEFVKYVHTGEFNKVYPPIDEILKPTGGVLLYQEQLSRICQDVYGLTAVQADEVRRATGKKDRVEMSKWEPFIIEGGKTRGVPESVTKWFWDICDAAADYSFCAAHAYAYSYITAQMTYLKAHHPKEFVLAQLKMSRHEPDSQTVLNNIITESKQMGINVLPPDITKSEADFSIEPNGVRFGLSHIRGVSDTTMLKLVSFKRDFSDKFALFSAAKEAGLTTAVLQSLIMSGCVNIDNTPRTKLAVEAAMFNELTPREKTSIIPMFAQEYGHDLIELIKGIQTKVDEKGKPYIKPSRMETYRRDIKGIWNQYVQNAKYEELSSYLFERYLLGFSYSNSLFNLYARKVEGLIPVSEVLIARKGEEVSFVAFVDEVKKGTGKTSKKEYVRFHLSEESGAIKAMVNGRDKIDKCIEFNGELPNEAAIVIVHGTKADDGGDMVFAKSVVLQRSPIKLKKDGNVEIT